MKTLLVVLAIGLAVAGCGSSQQDQARACGHKAAGSFTPGFGGSDRATLQQTVAQAASDYYTITGKC